MAAIYFSEYFVYLEWPVCLLVNWLIFFSIPLWVGPAYMIMILIRAWTSKKNVERSVMTGKIWFHEQYKMW